MNQVWQKKNEPQPPLDEMTGKGHFGKIVDIEDPTKEENDWHKAHITME